MFDYLYNGFLRAIVSYTDDYWGSTPGLYSFLDLIVCFSFIFLILRLAFMFFDLFRLR